MKPKATNMVQAVLQDLRTAGPRAVAPRQRRCLSETPEPFTAEDAAKLFASTGVYECRVAPPHICSSDLRVAAAEDLLKQFDWDPASVDVLIFVTQSSDHTVPAGACVMHKRLGLASGAACFDMNLGCSGFIYGIWTAGRLLSGSTARRALVPAGDTSARNVVPDDRSTVPLFGDAGSAAALETAEGASPIHIVLGTDGSGAANIRVKAGGRRVDLTPGLVARSKDEETRLFDDARLRLNGPEVFAFALKVVPPLVRDMLAFAGRTIDEIDYCVMHQANGFPLEYLCEKLKFPKDKFIIDMRDFGNTSSASIPLAIAHRLSEPLSDARHIVCCRPDSASVGPGELWSAISAPSPRRKWPSFPTTSPSWSREARPEITFDSLEFHLHITKGDKGYYDRGQVGYSA